MEYNIPISGSASRTFAPVGTVGGTTIIFSSPDASVDAGQTITPSATSTATASAANGNAAASSGGNADAAGGGGGGAVSGDLSVLGNSPGLLILGLGLIAFLLTHKK